MIVLAHIEEVELASTEGRTVLGVEATCPRCSRSARSFGYSDRSIRRCLRLLREECPRGERNFYTDDESELDRANDPRSLNKRILAGLDREYGPLTTEERC